MQARLAQEYPAEKERILYVVGKRGQPIQRGRLDIIDAIGIGLYNLRKERRDNGL